MLKVVELRDGRPKLNDIPSMMRSIADQIEAGEIEADSALFILPREGDWPEVFGWGDALGEYGCIAVCEMAKAWFINNSTERQS